MSALSLLMMITCVFAKEFIQNRGNISSLFTNIVLLMCVKYTVSSDGKTLSDADLVRLIQQDLADRSYHHRNPRPNEYEIHSTTTDQDDIDDNFEWIIMTIEKLNETKSTLEESELMQNYEDLINEMIDEIDDTINIWFAISEDSEALNEVVNLPEMKSNIYSNEDMFVGDTMSVLIIINEIEDLIQDTDDQELSDKMEVILNNYKNIMSKTERLMQLMDEIKDLAIF